MLKLTSKTLLISSVFIAGLSAQASVWNTTQTWNDSWEQQYSDWVKSDFNEDIFTTGRWKGISTDCADALYAARIIFSYENGLPFKIINHATGSGFITNDLSNWDGAKNGDSRVKSFISYITGIVGTKTLPLDSYPVAIDRSYIKAGAIWSRPRITKENYFRKLLGLSTPEDPGHAEIVKDVSDSGVITLMGSTVPAAVRALNVTTSLVFMPIETSTGFRRWKEPQDYGVPESQLPGYSLEQFKVGKSTASNAPSAGEGSGAATNSSGERKLDQWIMDVQNQLALRAESSEEKINRHVNDLCKLIQARVAAVKEGVAAHEKLNRCMNAEEFDSYSTPSRDKRIMTTIDQLLNAAGLNSLFSRGSAIGKLKANFDQCQGVDVGDGSTIPMDQAVSLFIQKQTSSDPNQNLRARWGLEQAQNLGCKQYY